MREGSGGWRMIPGKDPTSARISGTGGNKENNVLELIFVLLRSAKVIPNVLFVTRKYVTLL